MAFLTAGYFPNNYFPANYWNDDYWPDGTGFTVAALTPGYFNNTYFLKSFWADDYWLDYGSDVVVEPASKVYFTTGIVVETIRSRIRPPGSAGNVRKPGAARMPKGPKTF